MPSARQGYRLRQLFHGFDQACCSKKWPYNDPRCISQLDAVRPGSFPSAKLVVEANLRQYNMKIIANEQPYPALQLLLATLGSRVKGKIVHEAMGRTENKDFSRVRELMWKNTTAPEFAQVVEQETDRRNMT